MGKRKERFTKLKDGQVLELDIANGEQWRFACCDCGLIHRMAFAIEENGKLGIAVKREQSATIQRRKTFRSEDKDLCLWPYRKCKMSGTSS